MLEAALFGVPDKPLGEAVFAVMVPRTDAQGVDTAEFLSFYRERIAGYKVPKGIELRAEPLPKSGPGKVRKRELRSPHREGHEHDIS